MKKLDMMFEIFNRINKNNSQNVSDLSDYYKMTSRNVLRYTNVLVDMGYIKKNGKNYSVLKEIDLLELVLNELKSDTYSKFKNIKSVFKKLQEDRAYKKNTLLKDYSNDSEVKKNIGKLQEAIKDKTKISFIYSNKKRFIEPLKVFFFEHNAYLFANEDNFDYCKHYKVSEISNIEVYKKNNAKVCFEVSEDILEKLENVDSPWYKIDVEPYEVELVILNKKLLTKDSFNKNRGASQEDYDDYRLIKLKITDDMEIIPLILAYIPHIIVLKPDRLQKLIDEKIKVYKKRKKEILTK
jgi:predicted DNA-binding transcriptional regulator YafY